MKTTNTPAGHTLEVTSHLSDAVLQAWTWRFFRKHAADLGGDSWRKKPTFRTQEGAMKWLKTVEAWYAIVHPAPDR